MKLQEILQESSADIVARFYREATEASDRHYNPEASKYKDQTRSYYKKNLGDWFEKGEVPVFTKPITKAQPKYDVNPGQDKLQSPGYRGLQYARAAAGLPYDKNVQKYRVNPSNLLKSQTMDATLNNNGQ